MLPISGSPCSAEAVIGKRVGNVGERTQFTRKNILQAENINGVQFLETVISDFEKSKLKLYRFFLIFHKL